jgi:CheY-like chemotaxis protein
VSIEAVPAPNQRSALPLRALVIESNVEVARALELGLSLLGLDVRVAWNAFVGQALARTFHPQVVLCDLDLSDVDGDEIASSFRRDRELCNAHLIAFSSGPRAAEARRAIDAGFACHIAKPVSLDALIDAIAAAGQRR